MDAELAAIVARPLSFELGDPAAAGSPATVFTEHNWDPDAPGRDELAISDQFIPGPEGAPDVGVRIYDPPGRTDPAPCLVYFHGGGFIAGDLDTEDVRCVRLANDVGCVVVSVDYRLAPSTPFLPRSTIAMRRCSGLPRWWSISRSTRRASASEARAQAALWQPRSRSWRVTGTGRRSRSSCSCIPVSTIAPRPSRCASSAPPSWMEGPSRGCGTRTSARTDRTSLRTRRPRAEELGGLPPAYVMTAELDPLRDEGVEYAMRLLHAGVSVELHQFAGAFHGFDLLPTANLAPGRGRTGRLAAYDHTTCARSQGGNTMKRTRSVGFGALGARSEHGACEPDGGRRDRGERGRGDLGRQE